MKLHKIVSEDPRYLDIVRRREELAQRRTAFQERAVGETEGFAAAESEYRRRLARAMGAEEIAEIEVPSPPALIDPRTIREVWEMHRAEDASIDRDEHELFVVLAAEKVTEIIDRRRELRTEAQRLLGPTLGELQAGVGELNDLLHTEHVLLLANAFERSRSQGAGLDRPKKPAAVSLKDVLASIIREPVAAPARDPRGLVPDWWQRRQRREAERSRQAEREQAS